MSAFIVGENHIEALVALGIFGPSGESEYNPNLDLTWYESQDGHWSEWVAHSLRGNINEAKRIGQVLIDECVRSVSHRYQDNDDLPGPVDPYYLRQYEFRIPRRRPNVVEGLSILRCYEYQSCEHDGWHTSEAKRYCEALRDMLISSLPGMQAAPWEWDDAPVKA